MGGMGGGSGLLDVRQSTELLGIKATKTFREIDWSIANQGSTPFRTLHMPLVLRLPHEDSPPEKKWSYFEVPSPYP